MIRGGPDRAKVSQTYTIKRIDYSLRMARRLSEDTLGVERKSSALSEYFAF